jgi:hypothetical protein
MITTPYERLSPWERKNEAERAAVTAALRMSTALRARRSRGNLNGCVREVTGVEPCDMAMFAKDYARAFVGS